MSDEEREYLNETIRNLNNRLVDALRERDEARRRICETTDMTNPSDDCYVRLTPQQIAKHYGWDCLEPRKPWDCHKDYK